MPFGPPVVIEPPVPQPLRYGLFNAVGALLPMTDHEQGSGLIYEPETCGVAHSWPMECDPDESPDESPTEKVFDGIPDFIRVEPFVVYGSSTCGAAGTDVARAEARARRNLENGQQFEVESALAAELSVAAVGLPAAAGIVGAVAAMEQWLYGTRAYGRVGFIHASPEIAAQAASEHLWERDGSRYRTPYGTIWSVGGGYPPGTLYISGQVRVWQSEVEVPNPMQTFDRTFNQWYVLAERVFAAQFECAAASITITD